MTNIPTIQQLQNSIISDIETQYGVTIPSYGQSVLRVLAFVWAGKLRLQYLYNGFIQKQVFPDVADVESQGGTLERFGRVMLGRNPYQAVSGQYTATVSGTIGAVIKASTTFKSDDSSLNPGYLFVLDNTFTLVTGTDSITLRALTTGEDSRLSLGDTLTVTSPIALVNSVVTVNAITVQPIAAEDIEAYRKKILNKFRLEPQGGSGTDYRMWASDALGVLRVYPYAKSGFPSQVNIYIEATTIDSSDGKGTPPALMVTNVQNVINFNPNLTTPFNARRPLQVIVNLLPVVIKSVDINISGYTAITSTIQANLLAALTTMCTGIRPFVDSCDDITLKNNLLDNNKIISAVLNQQPGATFGTITIKINSVLVTNFTFYNGDIPYLNSVTYV